MTEIHSCSYYCDRPECIKAQRDELRERLAQPEQEPVAWLYRDSCGAVKLSQVTPPPVRAFPVYTAPPQRKPLTDKQILADETLRYYFGQNGGAGPVSKQGRKVIDAIEAAHGIKGEA